ELTRLVEYYYLSLTIVIAAIFIFINRVLFNALKRPEIFSWIEPDELKQALPEPEKNISTLHTNDADKKSLDLLLLYMQTKKPFLEPELNVESLAIQVSLKPKELSRLINENLNQNFFDFVNRYRIDEAKRLLTNPADKKITVLEVLYEVGFNSKSSFNTLFKKYTGVTPSEFKKQNMG
ncbi:MAG TPA: helix-turn-helix domain-containing protein, partial [Panacibacter sp.]|nr:helix-turn-helix domain-containing protein [Panacibacter sp.]